MKRFGIILAVLLMATLANAQEDKGTDNNELNTVFGKHEKVRIGWFIGAESGYTQLSGRDAWMGGLNFGMVIDHSFSIGLVGKGWNNHENLYFDNIDTVNGQWTGGYLQGCYGGLLLEYTLFPKSVVHVTFPLLIGAGNINYVSKEEFPEYENHKWEMNTKTLDSKSFFVVEPGIRAELNLFKFMRLNAGLSYRYVPNLEVKNTSPSLLNNLTATIGLKFGKFN